MERPLLLLALVLLGAALVHQALALRGAGARRRRRRAAVLDAALPLLDGAARRVAPDGFGRVSGGSGGARADLRVVADTLSLRKLPALWVVATLPAPQPLPATWHLMLRPRGTEAFSAFDRLPNHLPLPPGLPADAGLRSDGGPPPPAVREALALAVARLGEARLKEVVLSPHGLRLTWLAEEADRGRYLLFREAELGAPAPAADLAALLATLLALRDALAPCRLPA